MDCGRSKGRKTEAVLLTFMQIDDRHAAPSRRRIVAAYEGELVRRGRSPADFEEIDGNLPFLVDQLEYEPQMCSNGEGVRSDGTIEWVGGDARYLYVLDPGTDGPLAPPNFDEPAGTRWLLEVPWTEDPMRSGFNVSDPPAQASQRIPASGSFPALEPGQAYALYAYRDVLLPITRCLFVYE